MAWVAAAGFGCTPPLRALRRLLPATKKIPSELVQGRDRTFLLVAIRVEEIPLLAHQLSDAVFEYSFTE